MSKHKKYNRIIANFLGYETFTKWTNYFNASNGKKFHKAIWEPRFEKDWNLLIKECLKAYNIVQFIVVLQSVNV